MCLTTWRGQYLVKWSNTLGLYTSSTKLTDLETFSPCKSCHCSPYVPSPIPLGSHCHPWWRSTGHWQGAHNEHVHEHRLLLAYGPQRHHRIVLFNGGEHARFRALFQERARRLSPIFCLASDWDSWCADAYFRHIGSQLHLGRLPMVHASGHRRL